MQEYIAMWKNYVNFKDRTSVRGYWMAILFNVIAAFILGMIANFIPALSFLSGLYSLAVLIPGLALVVRRLRDTGKAWYYIFFALIPLVGSIILLVFMCQKTTNFEGEQV